MRRVNGVIFDMDGLIFDTERLSFNAWRDICAEIGYEMDRAFYCTLIGRNLKGFGKLMIEKFGEDFPLESLYEKKIKHQMKAIEKDGIPLKRGLHELLNYLKENGYKVAVATSTSRDRAEYLLKLGGVLEKADYVICGDEVVNSKPDPEIFLKAAEKLGVEPKECMVLEDSGAGIEAAYSAGMLGVNIPDMKEPDENMKSKSYRICESLLDVIDILENV